MEEWLRPRPPSTFTEVVIRILDSVAVAVHFFLSFGEDQGVTFTSFKGALRESWDDYRLSFARLGLRQSIPNMMKNMFISTVYIIAYAIMCVGYFIVTLLRCRLILERFTRYFNRRHKEEQTRIFQNRFYYHPPGHQGSSTRKNNFISRDTSANSKCILFRMPAEIRRAILLEAFGGRTLHMNLEYQHPFALARCERFPDPRYADHARIDRVIQSEFSHLRIEEVRSWMWFGCVCHRSPPEDAGTIRSIGAFESRCHFDETREPEDDLCLQGIGFCPRFPGKWVDKCQIGIMGWLLTCRQAYFEGFNVLYQTNTFHIESPILHHKLQHIMSPAVLTSLTSLQLVWDINVLPLAHGFLSDWENEDPSTPSPLFPNLKKLRISFAHGTSKAEILQLEAADIEPAQVARQLNNMFLPLLDHFVARIVPPTTDVTISCPSWFWFTAIDLTMIDAQGLELSKPQQSEMGGIKVWRRTPALERKAAREEATDERSLEEGTDQEVIREGFWVHSAHAAQEHLFRENPRRARFYKVKEDMFVRPRRFRLE